MGLVMDEIQGTIDDQIIEKENEEISKKLVIFAEATLEYNKVNPPSEGEDSIDFIKGATYRGTSTFNEQYTQGGPWGSNAQWIYEGDDAELSRFTGYEHRIPLDENLDGIQDGLETGDFNYWRQAEFIAQAEDWSKMNPDYDTKIIPYRGKEELESVLKDLSESGWLEDNTEAMLLGHSSRRGRYGNVLPDQWELLLDEYHISNKINNVVLGSCKMGDNPLACSDWADAFEAPVSGQNESSWGVGTIDPKYHGSGTLAERTSVPVWGRPNYTTYGKDRTEAMDTYLATQAQNPHGTNIGLGYDYERLDIPLDEYAHGSEFQALMNQPPIDSTTDTGEYSTMSFYDRMPISAIYTLMKDDPKYDQQVLEDLLSIPFEGGRRKTAQMLHRYYYSVENLTPGPYTDQSIIENLQRDQDTYWDLPETIRRPEQQYFEDINY
jgi:hypothetical protein